MRARGDDRRLEHGVARAIEADELAARAVVHDRGIDARARRRRVDVAHLELAPRARGLEHHAAHAHGGKRGILRARDRGAREEHHVVGEIHDGGAAVAQIAKGRGLEKRLDDDAIVAPLHAHGREVDDAGGVHGGDDRFDDHAPHSARTSAAYASMRRRVTGPSWPVPTAVVAMRTSGAISRMELVRNSSLAIASSGSAISRSTAPMPSAGASSSTAARVIPGSTPQPSGRSDERVVDHREEIARGRLRDVPRGVEKDRVVGTGGLAPATSASTDSV